MLQNRLVVDIFLEQTHVMSITSICEHAWVLGLDGLPRLPHLFPLGLIVGAYSKYTLTITFFDLHYCFIYNFEIVICSFLLRSRVYNIVQIIFFPVVNEWATIGSFCTLDQPSWQMTNVSLFSILLFISAEMSS
jgi:hypothetical protein